EVELTYPKGKQCPVVVRALNLKGDARVELDERHEVHDESGRYAARFGPLTAAEKQVKFSLEFQSMKALKEQAIKVELDMPSPPTNRNPLNQVPVPQSN